MRHRTIQAIRRQEHFIREEGFGIASVAREGAVEVRELAEHMRRLKTADDPVSASRAKELAMSVWEFAALQPLAAVILAGFALAALCVVVVYAVTLAEIVRDWRRK